MGSDANIPPRFTFPKAEHLKSRKAIELLFKTGKSFFVRPYKVFYQIADTDITPATQNNIAKTDDQKQLTGEKKLPTVPVQAGFAVSTRNFKHAVDRNRVKRIGREGYRLNKHHLTTAVSVKNQQLQVFFVYTDKTLPNFTEAEVIMKQCLLKLQAIIEK